MSFFRQINSIELKISSNKFIRTRNFLFLSFDRSYNLEGVTSIHLVKGELDFYLGLVYSNKGHSIIEIADWNIDARISEVLNLFEKHYNLEIIVDNQEFYELWMFRGIIQSYSIYS